MWLIFTFKGCHPVSLMAHIYARMLQSCCTQHQLLGYIRSITVWFMTITTHYDRSPITNRYKKILRFWNYHPILDNLDQYRPMVCTFTWCSVIGLPETKQHWLADRTRLFVQCTISLSPLCKLVWKHWTYKMPRKYILSSVWVRLSISSQLSIIQYVGLCFQFTHFPCDNWENIYTLSYYHHQIGSMNYYPLFRVWSLNNGVRCMSFYILIRLLWTVEGIKGYWGS